MFDWDTYANEDYEYEYSRTVSDSEEFSYDDDGWDYDDEEREEVAVLEEEYHNWYKEQLKQHYHWKNMMQEV